jgi:hypothetical protein
MALPILSMKNRSSFPLFLTSFGGVFFCLFLGIPSTEATEQLPLKSNFCVALFDTNAKLKEASKKPTPETQNSWPIKTMVQSLQLQQAASQGLMNSLMKPSKNLGKDLLKLKSSFARINKEIDPLSPMKFDSRIPADRLNHDDITMANFTLLQRQFLTDLMQRANEYLPLADIHEVRGKQEILNYLQDIQEQAKQWQNLTNPALETEAHTFSKIEKRTLYGSFLSNSLAAYLLFSIASHTYQTWSSGELLPLLTVALNTGVLFHFRKDIQISLKNFYQLMKAKSSTSAWNKYINESRNSTQETTNFLHEIELILSGQSPWSSTMDSIYLHEPSPVTAELGNALAFGPNHQDYTEQQLVQNEKHLHQMKKFSPELWVAGYSFFFSYLPKQTKNSDSKDDTASDHQELEPVLLVTNYLMKGQPPSKPSRPQGGGPKIPVEKELQWDEGLAPNLVPIPVPK